MLPVTYFGSLVEEDDAEDELDNEIFESPRLLSS
jgi:hypothetical protein